MAGRRSVKHPSLLELHSHLAEPSLLASKPEVFIHRSIGQDR